MPANERRQGHDAERAVARYLKDHGYPLAITTRQANAHDGIALAEDVIGVPGVSIEVKNRRALAIGPALRQAAIQGGPDKVALVVVKPVGIGLESVGDWWAISYMRHMIGLLPEEGAL